MIRRRDFLLMPFALRLARNAAGAVRDADWPCFRGPDGAGVAEGYPTAIRWNADSSAGSPAGVRWVSPIPGLGHSSPIVSGDRLFVASAVRSGGDAPLKLGLYGDPEAADDNGEQSWVLHCLDKRSGKSLWTETARKGDPRAARHPKATHANTTLATDGQHLVAFFGSEGLYCYRLDGKLIWSRDFGVINVSKYGIGWGFASSPTIHQGRILLQCDAPDDPFLAAVALTDGALLWRTSRKGVCDRCWATPLVHSDGGRVQVVTNGWPYMAGYDIEDGKELWRLRGGGDNPIPTPIASGGLIFLANGHGGRAPLYAIRPSASGEISLADGALQNRHVAWSVEQNGAYIQTPLVYGEYLYSGTNNGVLKCYEARTGQRQYQVRLGSGGVGFSASPVAADGKIYCASEDGDVYVVQAGSEFKLLATNRMGGQCMATPAISEGVLYFRTVRNLVAVSHS